MDAVYLPHENKKEKKKKDCTFQEKNIFFFFLKLDIYYFIAVILA